MGSEARALGESPSETATAIQATAKRMEKGMVFTARTVAGWLADSMSSFAEESQPTVRVIAGPKARSIPAWAKGPGKVLENNIRAEGPSHRFVIIRTRRSRD